MGWRARGVVTTQYTPPDGPRWVRDAVEYTPQTDGRGNSWYVHKVEDGGRVLQWRSTDNLRGARTEITPDHPDYPSDAAVIEWKRAERARLRELAQW